MYTNIILITVLILNYRVPRGKIIAWCVITVVNHGLFHCEIMLVISYYKGVTSEESIHHNIYVPKHNNF